MARQRKPAKTGRELTLEIVDRILGKKTNRDLIEKALWQKLQDDPLAFYRTYVEPLEQKRAKPAEAKPSVEGADLARQVSEMADAGAEPKPESQGEEKP